MKNVTEVREFARRAVNGAKEIAKDGLGSEDIGTVIGLIQPGTAAFEDLNLYLPEIGVSTNEDMDLSDNQVQGLLPAYSEEDQRDFDAIEKGIVAVTRKIARARLEGITEGRAQILSEMSSQGIDITGFSA